LPLLLVFSHAHVLFVVEGLCRRGGCLGWLCGIHPGTAGCLVVARLLGAAPTAAATAARASRTAAAAAGLIVGAFGAGRAVIAGRLAFLLSLLAAIRLMAPAAATVRRFHPTGLTAFVPCVVPALVPPLSAVVVPAVVPGLAPDFCRGTRLITAT
jgi:hypothetical protein